MPYDGIKFQVGRLTEVGPARSRPVDDLERDLPRGENAVAQIGDDRNDENLVVAQLHVAFLRFHNAAVDWVRGERAGAGERPRGLPPGTRSHALDLPVARRARLPAHGGAPDVVDSV